MLLISCFHNKLCSVGFKIGKGTKSSSLEILGKTLKFPIIACSFYDNLVRGGQNSNRICLSQGKVLRQNVDGGI